MKKKPDIEITELIIARASRDKFFYGTIKRLKDRNGIPYVFGKIDVLNGFVCAIAASDMELTTKVDEMVVLVLDYSLHSGANGTTIISNTNYSKN